MDNPVDLIIRKRDGKELKDEEIQEWIARYVAGEIPDYQMSSFLMAVYFRGMNPEETMSLTRAMIASGKILDLSGIPKIKVDKHSTGGVGDKVSLVLAPLVAAAGAAVPMMSGRGLGHTGGTLDKLESIPGFRTDFREEEIRRQLIQLGVVMVGQTASVVPADRLLYALRDVTGTVPSIPLICSSILSKKKAEGTDALVLDVKVGKGAFLPSQKQTVRLAESLVSLGNDLGIRTAALLTAMDEPLGLTVGNWLEVREAVEALQGEGPPDLMEITESLGSLMLVLGERARSMDEGASMIREQISSGKGFRVFREMVAMQGGDTTFLDAPERYPLSRTVIPVFSPKEGLVSALNALEIGGLAMDLGAGRTRKEEKVDPKAGIVLEKKIGDRVRHGELLATLYTDKETGSRWESRLVDAFRFSRTAVRRAPNRILDLIDPYGFSGASGELPVSNRHACV